MLNKKYKLLKTEEISAVFNFRKRLHTDHLYIHFSPNKLNHYRIGFVISKKIENHKLKCVQLHGDEAPYLCKKFLDFNI